jgi:hypothetical protein
VIDSGFWIADFGGVVQSQIREPMKKRPAPPDDF